MENRVAISYFSGTGNTELIAKEFKKCFEEKGYPLSLFRLDEQPYPFPTDEYSLLGFGFPIYAFHIPDFVMNKWRNFPEAKGNQKAFIIGTSGGRFLSAALPLVRLIEDKGYDVIRARFFTMPGNIYPNYIYGKLYKKGDPKRIERALQQVGEEVQLIISGLRFIEVQYAGCPLNAGMHVLDRMFERWATALNASFARIEPSCNSCQLCYRSCPANAIEWRDGKPSFTNRCILCCRCFNICPQYAIRFRGLSRNKEMRYIAPEFVPPILRDEVNNG